MRKNKDGHAWCYWDCRKKQSGGYWFVMISTEEIDRAIQQLSSAGALKVYLYILKMVNGKTMDRFADGQILGETMIAEACNISRATMYRATKELEKAGLLSISKFGGETKALLVSPQKGVEVDHRRSIKNEKKEENNKKIQSQIRDCTNSQKVDNDTQLCQKSQSQIRHNDLDLQELNYPPYRAPIDLTVANDTAPKSVARSSGAVRSKDGARGITHHESFLEGVSQELIDALCSILARSEDNLRTARLSPSKTVRSLTARSAVNGHSRLNQCGWYGSHRKRHIERVLEAILAIYFNDKTKEATITHYRDNAKPKIQEVAPKTQTRIKTLNDSMLLQYEKEIAELKQRGRKDPISIATIIRYFNDFSRIESEYTLTPDQKAWLLRLSQELNNG